jgi:hypothetical protein
LKHLLILCFLIKLALSQNPCQDSLYNNLKHKNLDSMSQREYDYFMLKEKNCGDEFTKNSASTEKISGNKEKKTRIVVDYKMEKEYLGFKPEIGVYVDDVFFGKPLSIINISPGVHTISLFQEKAYQEASKNDKKRMNGGIVKINSEPDKVTKIKFTYKCQTGINFICNDNEWVFINEVLQ